MRYLLQILFIALLAGTSQAEPLEDMTQSELKQRLSEIDPPLRPASPQHPGQRRGSDRLPLVSYQRCHSAKLDRN